MAVKPETRFAKTLFSKLPDSVYFEKTNNPYRAAMPDFYIEGPKGIIWVEIKWIPEPWIRNREASKICSTVSWIKQRRWLARAHANNVNTGVIIGIGSGRETRAYLLEFPYSFSFDENPILMPIDVLNYLETKVA